MKKRITLMIMVIMVVTFMTACTEEMKKEEVSVLLVGYGWFSGIPEGQTNNAELVVNALDGEKITLEEGSKTAVIHSLVVPVEWDKALSPVEEAIEKYNPKIVIGIGTAAGISGLRVEPYGVNWMKGTDADPENPELQISKNEKIMADGPDYIKGSLPYKNIVMTLLENEIPATLGKITPIETPDKSVSSTTSSTSTALPVGNVMPDISHTSTTGMYLCNYMTYMLPNILLEQPDVMTGFIHLPTQPGYVTQTRLNQLKDMSDEEQERWLTFSYPATMSLEQMIDGIRVSVETSFKGFE